MSITQLWGVPVYKESTGFTWENFSDKEKEEFENYEKNQIGKLPHMEDLKSFNSRPKVVYGNPKGKILDNPLLKRISNFVNEHVELYRKNVMCVKQEMVRTASWFTVQKNKDSHPKHNHKHAVISVCFYPQVHSGNLQLWAVNEKNSFQEHYHFGYIYNKSNVFNANRWELRVSPGDIVIFPGYVRHGTSRNNSDERRMMIGANYMPKGDMTFIDDLDKIKLGVDV